ncbi:MAG: N-acetylmuramoyl-L-alanine amidase [Lachnospiraceae bacterium]|nr:N-acetylmuramoyl-L-alanine amidase [Lachnospiraceae bacterium]MBO4558740.1 N-acetylmuramoyl-L-alanine amidase [Lachnospiraceae bacterium]
MNELIKRIAIIAAIFLGAVLIMSLAAKLMMHAEAKEADAATEQTGTGADASADKTDGNKAQDPASDAGQSSDASNAGTADGQTSDAGNTASGEGTNTADAGNTGDGAGAADAGNTPTGDAQPTDVPSGKHIVVIDAAHQLRNNNETEPIGPGSSKTEKKVNSGAEGVATYTPEYQFNLDMAVLLRAELEKRGYAVYMVREENDVMISNAERALIANNQGEIVLHLHGNSDDRSSIKGIMAFCPSDDNEFLSSSLISDCNKLCGSILTELEASTGAKNWGTIKIDSFPELNWTKIPAARVEVGYLSNADEDKLLQTADYRAKIVQGLADGIDRYFGE